MAGPVNVDCPAGVWTLVASSVISGQLWKVAPGTHYRQTWRDTGDAAPTDPEEGAFFGDDYVPISGPHPGIDVYVWCHQKPGRVMVDNSENVIGPDAIGKKDADVFIQDQTTPMFFIKASQVTNETTLALEALIDSYTFTVTDVAGINIGDYLGLFSLTTQRYYAAYILDIAGDVLIMDSPLDSTFPVGAIVGTGRTNMNVDGSVTPQEFSIRGADPGLTVVIDITRIIITGITTNAINLTDFGDIVNGLERGLLIRRKDGLTQNFLNLKTNIGMKGAMFDWDSLDDTNPGQGLHGFVGRLTFKKLGVVIRLAFGEELIYLAQDDLTQLLSLEVMNEGHIVD